MRFSMRIASGSTKLGRDARDDAMVPTTMVLLGLAAAELRTCKAVVALGGSRPHRVHAVLTDADNLRSAFATLASG